MRPETRGFESIPRLTAVVLGELLLWRARGGDLWSGVESEALLLSMHREWQWEIRGDLAEGAAMRLHVWKYV